ncbi:MAG TPA: hypothetical protein VMS79_05330, partial [Methanomassiliicoccales archaeon]|nr:hypothetical protein [Methanomassiliicoccales archaeon]
TVPGNSTSFEFDEALLYDHFDVRAVNEHGESIMTSLYFASKDLAAIDIGDVGFVLVMVAFAALVALSIGVVIHRRRR